ncbi:MAG: rhodanese-like domain-containing protein [Deltaproteobacteria bacterium]|nr:rhodanese-like domain-containing protein [Deltaproteobacteria bacterium]
MPQPRITAAELKKLIDSSDTPLILDVRGPNSYDASDKKIPGAVRIGLDELEGRLSELDRTRQVVAYCT